MTTQLNVKVRVVRCPRCSKLLPEMAEVPVYQCGGCGAVLKAKVRKTETKDTELHKADPTQETDSKDQGTDRLDQQKQTAVSSSSESAIDKRNEERENDDFVHHKAEQINGFNHADDLHSSTDHENSSNQDNRVDQTKRTDEDDLGDKNFCNQALPSAEPGEITSSDEQGEATSLAEPGETTSSAEPGETTSSAEPGEATSSAEPCEVTSSAEPCEATSSGELGEARSSGELGEARSSAEQAEASPSAEPCEVMSSAEPCEATSSGEPGEATSSSEPAEASPSTELSYENESSSPLPKTHIEVNERKSLEQSDQADQSEFGGDDSESDENLKSRPISKSSSEESLLNSTRMHSFATARRSFADSILTENFGSPPTEQIDQGQNRLFQGFERVSSTDTLENLSHVSTDLEPSFMLNNMSKSPTTKSYHAYYGSESSCNENEYLAQNRHFHAPKRIFKDKGLAQRDEFMMKHYPGEGNKLHQDEFLEPKRQVPRAPLYPRGTQANPSTYGHNKFEYDSMYERDRPESSKVELLKMVCELQGQLDRKYPLRYNQGPNWSQPFPANRNAFSGEAGHFQHQFDCSCIRCIPQEWRYSAQLPRHHVANKGYYMNHQNPSYYDSSSPIHYTGSEFSSWSRENNQWNKDQELKKLNSSSEKNHLVKRHCRPVAGGSPIIACYKCSALLQIPADFLVFKKRFHLLRCSACFEVLKFSVRDRVRLVRYIPDAATATAPPPSEVDEYSDTKRLRNLGLASASRVSEPISSSVDYGRSSTDGEFQGPVSSLEHVEDRKSKSILNELKSESKNEKSKSRKNGSPLHRLMGYASPSRVWRVDFNGL